MTDNEARARFLNVDLDIESPRKLDDLLSAMQPTTYALHVGRRGTRYHAVLELSRHPKNPESAIRRFAAIVRDLPPSARKCWDGASAKRFDIGLQSGYEPPSFEIEIDPRTLAAAADLGGSVKVTIYAPEPIKKARGASRIASRRRKRA